MICSHEVQQPGQKPQPFVLNKPEPDPKPHEFVPQLSRLTFQEHNNPDLRSVFEDPGERFQEPRPIFHDKERWIRRAEFLPSSLQIAGAGKDPIPVRGGGRERGTDPIGFFHNKDYRSMHGFTVQARSYQWKLNANPAR